MTLLQKFRVSGHSMEPTLKQGKGILASSLPYLFFKPKAGEIIAFKSKNNLIVKRIKAVRENKYLVQGDNKSDSKEFGWIEKGQIIGRVIYIMSS